jgi:hypothetical protein
VKSVKFLIHTMCYVLHIISYMCLGPVTCWSQKFSMLLYSLLSLDPVHYENLISSNYDDVDAADGDERYKHTGAVLSR